MNRNYKEKRPWGAFEVLMDDPNFKVKKITVDPGCRLSLQSHHERSEHWIVTEGNMRITVGEEVKDYPVDSHIYIPREHKHRMENCGEKPASVIEVQTGTYFGEDDIIRYEDDYNRI
ncbi:MAG: phosphomannose isomerase type II C-terminal cupin domain [Candidatus Marinimicrobia bacterium]|nr:phosphomannose isomerase type II C-terminal cupin domain [Candidatus Neomarinimicrobiota bacterium]